MKINVFRIFLISSFFVLSNICFAEINKDWLRRDETLALDEITLKFNNFCKPLPDTRTLGLGLDLLRFLDSEGRLLFTIDIGTEEGRYYLGEGWYGNEDWGNLTECWSNALAVKSRIYCYIPENSIYMELVCTTACNPINTEVTLNGQKIGEFSLPANSGFRTISIDLPKGFGRYMEYTLKSGGPLQISHLELIDSNGDVFSKIYSLCELAKPGDTAKFPVQISKGIGDLSLYLLKPAQNDSVLKFTINNANSIFFQIPTGSDYTDTTIKDALERQGDRKTQTSGWGEDFSSRNSFTAESYNCPLYPQVAYDGGSVGLLLPDQCNSMFVKLDLSKPLLLSEYPYLSLKIKVTKGDLYYIRPEGFDAQGNFVLLWYEDAATDDRRGTGNWETLTINLPELA
ncbi:hypothetical protein FJZ33_04435, partial [Candidatus Poribacteria bacterium]|nr:hypothetical protein [Candidatus Poribacteria bacterium]